MEAHARVALTHAISWIFTTSRSLDDEAKNVIRHICCSQLFVNMAKWMASNKACVEAVVRYLPSPTNVERVDLHALAPFMAMIHVGCHVGGMPGWRQASVEARDFETSIECTVETVRNARKKAMGQVPRMVTYLQEVFMDKVGDIANHYRHSEVTVAREAYECIPFEERSAMGTMRDLTSIATKLLVIKSPSTFIDVKAMLNMFVKHCPGGDDTDSDDDGSEPIAKEVAEKLADTIHMFTDRIGALETELAATAATAAESRSKACASEEIAMDASERFEERTKALDAFKKDIVKRLQRVENMCKGGSDAKYNRDGVDAAVAGAVAKAVEEAVDVAVAKAVDVAVAKAVDVAVAKAVDVAVAKAVAKAVEEAVDVAVAKAVEEAVEMTVDKVVDTVSDKVSTIDEVKDGLVDMEASIQEIMSRMGEKAPVDVDDMAAFKKEMTRSLDVMQCDMWALKRLVVGMGDARAELKAELITLKRQIECLVTHTHVQFCSQWNAAQMQWHVFQKNMQDVPLPKQWTS